jgi:hypothetical protein
MWAVAAYALGLVEKGTMLHGTTTDPVIEWRP